MKEPATDLLATESGGALTRPGDAFSLAFRERGGYRKAVLVGTACAVLSAGLIVADLTRSLPPQTGMTAAGRSAPPPRNEVPVNRVGSPTELVEQLKAHRLWEMPADSRIPPVIFANFPEGFDTLHVETKKRAFLHALLPAALLARSEIARERQTLLQILSKLDHPVRLDFDEEESEWQNRLSEPEITFLDHLIGKYRSRETSDLLARVDTLPVSLIMAQAALESSWGSSRFAEEANNIFGLWTWGDKGLVPTDREEGKEHKIAVYDSILGSIRAYLLTLNRLPAYRRLRQLRRETRDPLRLAEGLHSYSERGTDYVAAIKQIIRYNQLDRFDTYNLAGDPPGGSPRRVAVSQR